MMAPQAPAQPLSESLPETRRLRSFLWVLLILGAAAFLIGALGASPQRAWQTYLVNFLFWSGIAQAGIVFSAAYRLTNAHWGESMRRLAEGMAGVLPVSFVLFLLLFFGRSFLFPWIETSAHGKESWLNFPFLFARDGISLIMLYGVSFVYLYYTLRPIAGERFEGRGTPSGLHRFLIRGWQGLSGERARSERVLRSLAVAVVLTYAAVYTLLAFDLVMSLEPQWYSTLFGAYFFMGNFYLGLAFLGVTTILVRKSARLASQLPSRNFWDLGKLMLAFGMVTGDFFFSQFLVIWYGNLPEEITFVIHRTKDMPWATLSWIVLFGGYLGPVLLLFSRAVKLHARSFVLVSLLVLVVMWIERYLLVVPSLWHEKSLPLGWIEVLVTAGFAGAMGLSVLEFWRRLPFFFPSSGSKP
ncbi:MAG: hypothetical protein HYY65_04580 [Candidatus Tectomicrobia bacterium]|uniref:Molybdopterin oxidoreductase n=1 Tax=Tectimicrobiota bacterium TaxID=2528274 RepID=A0A932GND3_UNCTE|nr:hypothetical protein [Candidatus Tectomicrobia bacterium]